MSLFQPFTRLPIVMLLVGAWTTLLFLPRTVRAADENTSDTVQIQQTITNGFVHPGIGLTKEILENARRQIRDKKEPWYSGFQVLAADRYSAKTVKCRNESRTNPGKPDIDAFDSKSVEGRLQQDGPKAKQQALMYFFTGEDVYRANAMNIVRVWSQMDPKKYKMFPEAYIHASYPIQDLIMAAELLRYTSAQDPKLAWTEQDTQNFTDNCVSPAVKTFLDGNGWFMNQSGYPLAAAMSGDIFRSDRESYAKHVEWFTINKTAPNKGWAFSIHELIRRVDTNALTGQRAAHPVIQIVEMGRDQAHGGDDVDIFMNIARQMNAQNTKVNPVSGTISTAPDAVGPYEFLGDRILAGANYFWQFMLGYDTPWIPTPSDTTPDGKIKQSYPRLADNYRGRLAARELVDVWDAYYYYAFQKGVNVAQKAPYYQEAFAKRIVLSPTEWISIPANVSDEAARVPSREQAPDVIEVAQRSTPLSDEVAVINENGEGFLRITPSPAGTRFAILSSGTDEKTIALRLRTTGAAQATMSGLAKPWLWPDTQNEWRTVTYRMSDLERFKDIEFFSITGSPSVKVEIDRLVRVGAEKRDAPVFRSGGDEEKFVTAVGLPLNLDLSPDEKNQTVAIGSQNKPQGSTLKSGTGEFTWTPARPGDYAFIVTATNGESVAAKRVRIIVAPDRESAVRLIVAAYKNVPYVRATAQKWEKARRDINLLGKTADGQVFSAKLMQLEQAFDALEPLTPLLADGSMNFPKLVVSSNIGDSIGLLTDGNDDTFPVYTLAKDLNYVFDFGPDYRVSISAFAVEGRLNFENRTQDTVLFGSNDGTEWTPLTGPVTAPPTELTKLAVKPELANEQFRYLKLGKTSTQSAPLFEPSELRLYGKRYEVQQP